MGGAARERGGLGLASRVHAFTRSRVHALTHHVPQHRHGLDDGRSDRVVLREAHLERQFAPRPDRALLARYYDVPHHQVGRAIRLVPWLGHESVPCATMVGMVGMVGMVVMVVVVVAVLAIGQEA